MSEHFQQWRVKPPSPTELLLRIFEFDVHALNQLWVLALEANWSESLLGIIYARLRSKLEPFRLEAKTKEDEDFADEVERRLSEWIEKQRSAEASLGSKISGIRDRSTPRSDSTPLTQGPGG